MKRVLAALALLCVQIPLIAQAPPTGFLPVFGFGAPSVQHPVPDCRANRLYVDVLTGNTWSASATVAYPCGWLAGPTPGAAAWGQISGVLSAQTDLQTALNAKLPIAGGTLTGVLNAANAGVVEPQTCNAALVSNYAHAVCVYTLTSAQILAFPGNFTANVIVIAAPGAGRAIMPDGATYSAEYIFGTTPYSASINLVGGWGGQVSIIFSVTLDLTQSVNQVSWGGAYLGQDNIAASLIANVPYSLGSAATVTGGDGTIAVKIPYTVYPIL